MHHAKRVHDQSTRNCPYKKCQKTFKSATGLKDHVIKIHEKKKLKLKCTDCEKSFTHQHLLKGQIVSYSGICNYECKMCSKKFKYMHNLKEHEKNVPKGNKTPPCLPKEGLRMFSPTTYHQK